jgi:hypothetical protein
VMIQPGEAPLEIGSSLPSRTWLHLREDRAVARWPYGHDSFMLFVKVTCIEEELGRKVRCLAVAAGTGTLPAGGRV